MEDKPTIPGLIPQKDGSFAISIECPNGLVTPDTLKTVSELARKHNIIVHLTMAQKLMLLGMSEEIAKEVLETLENNGITVRKRRDLCHPRVCVGTPFCKLALQDTFAFGEYLYKETARIPIPPKLKIAIAGCPANCTWALNIDLGFVGIKSGYIVYIGGKGGSKPQEGIELTRINNYEDAIKITKNLAKLFSENVKIKSRVSFLIKKFNIEELRQRLLE